MQGDTADGINFMVVLRADIGEENAYLLRQVVRQSTLGNGQIARYIYSKSTEDCEGGYLGLEAAMVEGDAFVNIRIPHWMVLTIVGSRAGNPAGFVLGN